jgi:hypothetical protein
MAPMMYFFTPFHCLKKNWDFPTSTDIFPMMFLTMSPSSKYIKNTFDLSACNIPYALLVVLGVLQYYIQGLQLSSFNHLVPLIAQKENFHVQLSALSVSNVPFLHPC